MRNAWRGFLFGLGMFGVGVSWVYVSMHNYGNMPAPLASVAVLIFVAILSLYPAAVGWVQARYFRGVPVVLRLSMFLPALWVIGEWLRGWLLTGFPWLDLGYSQVGAPLSGIAAWLGVYGVSFVTVVSSGLLAAAWQQPGQMFRLGIIAAVLWGGAAACGLVQWVQPQDQTVKVALIQGNIPLRAKWSADALPAILNRYRDLSRQHLDADLIIWPEAAVPTYLHRVAPTFLHELKQDAMANGIDFIMGVVEQEQKNGEWKAYNSVISIGSGEGIYRKRHLVPFGEFLPLKPLLEWLLRYLHIPMSDFSSGPESAPYLKAGGQVVGISVCYEDAFGNEIIDALPRAALLVNVSEDAWFGDSLAPHQRVQMARMRAMETGRFMLRAANTGPSVAIDHRGRIIDRSPQFTEAALLVEVQPMQGQTPYARFGNWLIISSLIAVVLVGTLKSKEKISETQAN